MAWAPWDAWPEAEVDDLLLSWMRGEQGREYDRLCERGRSMLAAMASPAPPAPQAPEILDDLPEEEVA